MEKVGLVLEGGGMRGIYTCGVLDYFMENEIYFKYIIGVSAGICNAVSYASRQRGRSEKVILDYIDDKRYLSFRNLIRDKSLFGMEFIFNEIPNRYVPFDYDTFNNEEFEFIIGTTDCTTGKPVYFNKEDMRDGLDALRASASLPLVSPIVSYKGYDLLDGGVSDSIPIKKSIADGNERNIIVLTRNLEYRKKPSKLMKFLKYRYKDYPKLVEAMINRYKVYNETLDFIEQLEKEGKALVIRPSKEVKVGRYEKDRNRLMELFKNGYADANDLSNKIEEFIK
ncbi:Predicted phospholipase, patatin/cPLA2 family [Clostridium cavendishii DSM 21758]|uniref:Predicted phospholipase, patatin/cPLA2 family n=1 Tax=Clostridium cavendishii DSM 21758 TaxID=1121302 RepID=A0A1M6F0S8_9CLOT|nr:patatin family protein [Clostridium cavendishii]SHI91283.1 Predicted phospholipase, patatin/cPLA2 family [Clostridium cavendishii DSM 21758]